MNPGVNALVEETGSEREDRLDFSRRIAETRRRVFQIAYGVLRNPEDAEEVAQETYLRAYPRLTALRDPEKFRAWVGRIAFRLALNRRRQRQRRLARETRWQSESPAVAGHGAEGGIDLEKLQRRIDDLPQKYRSVFLLTAVEGMTGPEVARILGIRAGTVRSRLHEARRRLLEEMEK
jgi:RNA polymerase sigma-70 factor (ECF subfamily)